MNPSLLFIISLFSPKWAMAAACCGGGVSAPSVITGDDKALFTSSYAYTQLETDVSSDGIWQRRTDREISQILRLEGAHVFADRFQLGGGIPIAQRSSDRTSGSTQLGDTTLDLGYEILPDWDYNPWRPHGIGFLQIIFPTGKSINESSDPSLLDATGRGFWALGAGTVLTKALANWDFSLVMEVHRAFNKSTTDATTGEAIDLRPGWGGVLSIAGGWNWKNLRLGGGIAWNYEDPVNVSGSALNSQGSAQRYATGTLVASYLMAQGWATSLSYSDQTLFGSPNNTTLSRSILVSLQKHWER